MAQLAKQQEELRLREQSLAKEDDDDWDGHVAPAATYKPQSQPKTTKPQPISRPEPASKPEPSPKAAHPSNPAPVKAEPSTQQNYGPNTKSVPEAVSKSGAQVPQADSAEKKGSDTRSSFNPFAKSHPAPPSGEAKHTSATVAQPLATKPNPFGPRPATSNDEDWGSDDNESEDEDRPSGRANPTQLASLLFGTMGGPIRPQATGGSGTPSRPDSAAAVNAPQRRTQPEGDSGLKNAGTDTSNASYPTPTTEPSNVPPPVPATTNAEPPSTRPPVPASHNYEHAETFNPPPVPTSHDQVYAEPFSAPPPPPSGNNLEVPSYSYAADSESEFESADEGPSEPTSLPPPPPPPGVAPPPAPAPPPPPLAAPAPPTNSTGGAPGVSGGLGALLGDITKGTTLRRTPKESLQESSLGRVV